MRDRVPVDDGADRRAGVGEGVEHPGDLVRLQPQLAEPPELVEQVRRRLIEHRAELAVCQHQARPWRVVVAPAAYVDDVVDGALRTVAAQHAQAQR